MQCCIHRYKMSGCQGTLLLMSQTASPTDRRMPSSDAFPTSEDPWKFALEGAGDGIWEWDVATGTVTYSRQWKAMLGYAENEIGHGYAEWEDRVHPDDLPGAISLIKEHFEGRSPHYSSEFRMRTKDGGWKWILARGMVTSWYTAGHPKRLIGTHTDITADKAAKDREAANLKLIVEDAPLHSVLEAVVHSVEAEHPTMRGAVLLVVVEADQERFHVGAAPGLPEEFRDVLEGMSTDEASTCAGQCVKSGRRAFLQDIQSMVKWQAYREAAARAGLTSCWSEPIVGGSGHIHGVFTCCHVGSHTPNATEIGAIAAAAGLAALAVEREQERQILQESEERYRLLADNSEDIVCLSTTDGRLLYLSPSFHRKTGWTPDEMESSDWHLRSHPGDAPALERSRLANLDGEISTIEHRLLCRDGSWIWVETSCKPVLRDGIVWRLLTWSHDITDRKLLEKEIVETGEREQQRIGAEIHDDLCQRLASIKLKFEMLTSTLEAGQQPDPVQARQLWHQLADATRVARGIAKGLSPVDDQPESFMNALTTLVPSLEMIHGVPCFLHCHEPVTVHDRAVAAHLYRIAQELINNAARHAHPDRIDVRLEMNAEHVLLEVENDGEFFREPARPGPGMGLRILHFRANAIGATIQFLPRPGGSPGTLALCAVPQAMCNP